MHPELSTRTQINAETYLKYRLRNFYDPINMYLDCIDLPRLALIAVETHTFGFHASFFSASGGTNAKFARFYPLFLIFFSPFQVLRVF